MAGVTAAQALSLGADVAYLKKRAPPTAPTGYYDWQITTDPSDDREGHSIVSNLISKAETAKSQGVYVPNPRDVDAFLDAVVHPTGVDDRKGAFGTGLNIISRLDQSSDLAKKLNNAAIGLLYDTIPHPPEAFLGPEYTFRQADGGGNNLENPNMGRAGTAYARSVQGKTGLPSTSLPDAGLIFDSVLKRKGIVNHAAGFSTMIFALASIVTHSLFRTDHSNININNASSYLDLSPLYGDNQAAQDKIRDKSSGRGLLYPDTFSEERLLFLPPATSVLLVLFSRNHNYIAERLLKINERKQWSDPPPTDPAKRALQDEQIFQTARLVNGGQFMSTIMGDYVAGFLGASEGSNWTLDAFSIIDGKDLKVERGRGNHVSVEFNIMYRNSVYALYPFFTPEKMKDSLTKQGTASKYNFDHPTPLPIPKVLNTFTGIKTVWNDPQRFKVAYERVGYGSALVCDEPKQHDADRAMILHALFPEKESLNQYAVWVSGAIKEKIEQRSWKYTNVSGNYVDIVKDIVNAVAAHWAAEKLTGIPLKTKENPRGVFTENEFFEMLATLLIYGDQFAANGLAFDEPETRFALNEASAAAGINIAALLAKSIIEVTPASSPTVLGKIASAATSLIWSPKNEPWFPFLSRLAATGRPIDELIGNIVAVAAGSSVTWAHAATNVIDFYLSDARTKEREHIIELVHSKGPDSDTLLRGYVSEAMRLKPQYNGLWRKAVVDAVVHQGPGLPPADIKAGDWIWGSWRNAHLDPSEFPDPTNVNPRRPASAYANLNGTGFHVCAGVPFTVLTVVEILKIVFTLKNVRRAPGNAGILQGYTEIRRETETDIFIQRNGTVGLWPGSLHLT
ncbi:hypothetical protein H0H87_009602, partial [Tephrocybe sp. NHM501043]